MRDVVAQRCFRWRAGGDGPGGFPKGHPCLRIRQALGAVFTDAPSRICFPPRGRPAPSPGRLALVSVPQLGDDLSDRQAADAVRGRIQGNYALGLEPTDPGFDASVSCEFRARLVAGGAEPRIFKIPLAALRDAGRSRRGDVSAPTPPPYWPRSPRATGWSGPGGGCERRSTRRPRPIGLHPRAGPTRVGRPVGHRSGNTTCPRARPNAGRGPSGLAGMGSGCSRRCSPRAPRLRRRPYRRSSGRGARVHPYRSDNGQVRLRDVKDLPRPRYGGRFLRCGLHRLGGPGASAAMGPKRATTVPARMRGKRRRCRLNRGDPHPGHRRRCRGHRPHPRPACHPAVASRWQWGDTGSTSGAAGDRPPPLWPRPGPVQVPAGRQAREQTGFAPEDLPLGFEPASYLPARGAPAGGAVRVRLR